MTAPVTTADASTYHASALWDDGAWLNLEHHPTRDEAFDAAADAVTKWGLRVQVLRVHRSPITGRPIGVSDATAVLYAERQLGEVAA